MSTVTETIEACEVLSPRRMLESLPPETRVVIADVDWEVYERLLDSIGEGKNCRVAYDGKDIEMLSLGPFHERGKSFLDMFIMVVAGEKRIEYQPMGSTTWRRRKIERGIESDLCYYFDPLKLALVSAAQDSDDIDDYPGPDLAVEIDISQPKIDRVGIYARLEVPEVWRFHKGAVSITQLGPDGTYVQTDTSRFLPVRAEDVTRWVFREDRSKRGEWENRLRAWARTV